MPRISWINTGSEFKRIEGDFFNVDTLPVGVYEVGLWLSGWFLTRTSDKFVFNHKVYNLQRPFLDYVKQTYVNTTSNMGILMVGTRGSGKTCSAKVLANEMSLPIVIVKSMGENNGGMFSFLASFNFDCIFFFDEFEKQFSVDDSSILQFMDGVYASEYRRVCLLTTNELDINENLLSRPSRIRYVKKFGNLEKSVLEEYLNDNLKDLSAKDAIIEYVDTLTISTIDILKAVVEEVNIHGIEQFSKNKKDFNVQTGSYNYMNIYGYVPRRDYTSGTSTIKEYLKELAIFKNKGALELKFREKLNNAETAEERQEIYDERTKLFDFQFDFSYGSNLKLDKPWYKFVPGEEMMESAVLEVDLKNKIIVLGMDNWVYFHYIENPDAKPSIYNVRDL